MSINAAQFPATQVWDGTAPNRANRFDDKAPDSEDWDQMTAELIAAQTAIAAGTPSTSGNGVVAGATNTVVESLAGVHKTVITLTDFSMLVDTAADGFVGTKIYDFPAGLIRLHGAIMDLTLTTVGSDIDADAAVVASVGTVTCADDATLTSTEADIIPSTAYTLVASTKQAVGLGVTPAVFDGVTSAAVDAFLNIAVPDADRTATAQAITVTGTITITWTNLGDA